VINLDDLEAKAKATKGAYQVIPAMEYYEAANPATILALVKVCRAAKECSLGCMADKLREALEEIE